MKRTQGFTPQTTANFAALPNFAPVASCNHEENTASKDCGITIFLKIQTHKRFKRMLFIKLLGQKHNLHIFRVMPFIKLKMTLKQQLNDENNEKWVELFLFQICIFQLHEIQ